MNYKKLIISLVLPQLAGMLGVFFTVSSISVWYATLNKPWFSPPNWLFGPTWTTLYLLMGVAVYLVWQKRKSKLAVGLFWIHLVVNALWTPIFFGLRSPKLAFVEIVLLWILIVATIINFWKINRLSAYLMMPYLLWVSFAAILNFSIFILN